MNLPPGLGPAASRLAEGAMLPVPPVGLAVSAIIALGVIDRHRENYCRRLSLKPAVGAPSPACGGGNPRLQAPD